MNFILVHGRKSQEISFQRKLILFSGTACCILHVVCHKSSAHVQHVHVYVLSLNPPVYLIELSFALICVGTATYTWKICV